MNREILTFRDKAYQKFRKKTGFNRRTIKNIKMRERAGSLQL